jgi:hypothetical protein
MGCFQLESAPGDNQPPEPTLEEFADTPGPIAPTLEDFSPTLPPEAEPFPPIQEFEPVDLGKQARNPLVPLGGAALGTLLGVLVSVLRVWLTRGGPPNPARVSTAQPGVPSTQPPLEAPLHPPPQTVPDDPGFWNQWEQTVPMPPPDRPTTEPTLSELRQDRLDGLRSKEAILEQYHDDIPAWRQARIDPQRVHLVDKAEFDRKYAETFRTGNTQGVDGFADPNSMEVYIDRENYSNYTAVHEILHLSSNSAYGQAVKTAMDEATTEYFTLRLANKNQVARISLYTINDSTKVIDEMVRLVGEQAVRKAYFGDDPKGVETLRRLVDQKIRPGAFEKVIDLMSRDKHLHARELLRGTQPPSLVRR